MKELTQQQREAMASMDAVIIVNSMDDLLFWEMEGFGDYTVSELNDLLIDYIIASRKKKEA